MVELPMDPFLQFLLAVALVVVAAKSAGYLSTKLGQPAVLGEILAGLLLGPTVLNMLQWPVFSDPHLEETLSHLANLGVVLLMFIAGLEVDLRSMSQAGRPVVLAGVLGVLAPVGLGFAAALALGFDEQQSLAIGLVLAATSVSISAQTMMELGVLRSRVGVALLGAAVVDDVLVILLLSLLVALIGGGGGGVASLIWVVVKMVGFLGLAALLGAWLIRRVGSWVERQPISEGVLALAIVITLLFAWASEAIGGRGGHHRRVLSRVTLRADAATTAPRGGHAQPGILLARPDILREHWPSSQRPGLGPRRPALRIAHYCRSGGLQSLGERNRRSARRFLKR